MALPWQAQALQPVKPAKPSKPPRDSGIDTIGINQQNQQISSGVTTPVTPTYYAEYSPGRGGGGGGGGGPAAPLDYRDATYNAQIAALDRAMNDFSTATRANRQRYNSDFRTGMKSLGRRGEGEDATWDYEGEFSPFSSAARGTRTSRDEFAGRGTLRSSDFAKAYADFQDRLNEQSTSMETGRTRYLEDLKTAKATKKAETKEAKEQARLDAMTRAAIKAAGGIV
jgi:hypothetical protein